MGTLLNTFTSTGSKFFAHQEAMNNLRNGKGQPITTHVMLTDVCNHTCAFCSVQHRAGDALIFDDMLAYVDTLLKYGLKSVILSGGGNPILYRCRKTGNRFDDVVRELHKRGLEIGLITNGAPLYDYILERKCARRKSWKGVRPETLDKLTWIRISMAGLDHAEDGVYVPDVNHSKTTLGFSYVAHDIYIETADKKHGKVSRQADLMSGDLNRKPTWRFEDRIDHLTNQIRKYVKRTKPKYVRLLPNCLEPSLIPKRCEQLQRMADDIDPSVVFVQYKPPKAPKTCYLGYIHPVLNCDGFIYPCDSCVLNEAAGHQFNQTWRVCHWSDVATMYEKPVNSLIKDPAQQCPGCVFSSANRILGTVVDGTANISPPETQPEHVNFV